MPAAPAGRATQGWSPASRRPWPARRLIDRGVYRSTRHSRASGNPGATGSVVALDPRFREGDGGIWIRGLILPRRVKLFGGDFRFGDDFPLGAAPGSEEAVVAPGMTGHAVLIDEEQHRVAIAIEAQ